MPRASAGNQIMPHFGHLERAANKEGRQKNGPKTKGANGGVLSNSWRSSDLVKWRKI